LPAWIVAYVSSVRCVLRAVSICVWGVCRWVGVGVCVAAYVSSVGGMRWRVVSICVRVCVCVGGVYVMLRTCPLSGVRVGGLRAHVGVWVCGVCLYGLLCTCPVLGVCVWKFVYVPVCVGV